MGEAVPLSEARLLERARDGDVEAFGVLVERNQDYLYNAVYHMVGGGADAEDVAQEVFMRAYDNIARFEGRSAFRTWLYGIMLNTVRTHWRRRSRRQTVSLESARNEADNPRPDPAWDGDGPPQAAARDERVEAVRAAIAALDEDSREILVLRDIQGLSYQELGQALGLPAGTVKSRLHRARLALKERLEPLYGTEE
jgi:RNA polymerase sigma-70 factor (ECF subfamily)